MPPRKDVSVGVHRMQPTQFQHAKRLRQLLFKLHKTLTKCVAENHNKKVIIGPKGCRRHSKANATYVAAWQRTVCMEASTSETQPRQQQPGQDTTKTSAHSSDNPAPTPSYPCQHSFIRSGAPRGAICCASTNCPEFGQHVIPTI